MEVEKPGIQESPQIKCFQKHFLKLVIVNYSLDYSKHCNTGFSSQFYELVFSGT